MRKHIFHFIDNYKDSNNPIILLLKFIYSISFGWVLAIFDIAFGILIPIWWGTQRFSFIIVSTVILCIIHYYFDVVHDYKTKEYGYRKLSDDILNSCTVLTNSISEYITDDANHSNIFKFVAQAVCSEIYYCLKQYYKCEFRVSVIQQFDHSRSRTNCRMIGRKSRLKINNTNHKLQNVRKDANSYYYIDILLKNEETIYVLPTEKEIKKLFKHKKAKNRSKIKQYIGMPAFAYSDKIAFILQVDCMAENKLGKTTYDVESFAKRFLYPYLSILVNAYQQERSLTQ